MSTDQKLIDAINQSGFPLQIAIADLVQRTARKHQWKVLYTEHAWKNSVDGSSGFIDLVLEDAHQTSLLVVECKRVLESSWIFLKEKREITIKGDARLWITYQHGEAKKHFGWYDAGAQPTTPESPYCVVPGQDAKSRPMLERVASELVSSTEALAAEELSLLDPQRFALRMYASVLVTTATLRVCTLDAEDISVADGRLSEGAFSEVPFVRFRKQLSVHSTPSNANHVHGWDRLARGKEHTVFVVNSLALESFLNQWTVWDGTLRPLLQST